MASSEENASKIVKVYRWKGVNSRNRRVSGEIVSESRIDGELKLEARGILVKSISQKSFSGINPFNRVITSKSVTVFTRQIGMMMSSGMGLVESLEISVDSLSNPRLKSIVVKVKNDVAAGVSFSQALSKYPKYFDDVYINLVQAGQDNGVLTETLLSMAEQREKNEDLGGAFKKAMIYPSLVLLFAFGIVFFMLAKIVPEFESVYSSYDESLPAYTEFVLNLAKSFQDNMVAIMLVSFLFVLLFMLLKKFSYSFNLILSKLALRVPVLKHVFKKMSILRFFQTTLITHSSGLTLDKSIKSSSKSVKNKVYQEIFKEVSDDVRKGERMSDSLKNTGMIPESAIQFIESGESSGMMIESLHRGCILYEKEIDDQFIMSSKALEPIIMMIVSLVVGAIVVAMYLPIFYFGSIVG